MNLQNFKHLELNEIEVGYCLGGATKTGGGTSASGFNYCWDCIDGTLTTRVQDGTEPPDDCVCTEDDPIG